MNTRQKEHVMADPTLNIGSIPLGDHDADWFVVMARATGDSIRVKAGSVIGYYVRRRKDEYKLIIEYIARKYGLTFSECFHRLRRGEDLGTPVSNFDVDYEIEGLISKIRSEKEQTIDKLLTGRSIM